MTAVAPPLPELVSFLEQLREPHILCDREYRILAANAAYRKQCGGSHSVVGRTCYEVSHHYAVPCDQAGESCPLARSLDSGQRERVLHLHHTPGGKAYENIELTPLRDAGGSVAYFIEKLEPLQIARGVDNAKSLIGRSPAFTRLLELVARVAPSDASVLLQGESGTGKELVAQAIHDASRRSPRPFVVVDCSGLPETLFESELFGHERGAFTGATSRKPGLIERGERRHAVPRRGGRHPAGDAGQAAAADRDRHLSPGGRHRAPPGRRAPRVGHAPDLATDGGAREFRQDLFYRLSTFPIPVPALRDRRTDLPALRRSPDRAFRRDGRLAFAPAALRPAAAYDYPGNVRELRNVLERASLMCDGEVYRAPSTCPRKLRRGGQPGGCGG